MPDDLDRLHSMTPADDPVLAREHRGARQLLGGIGIGLARKLPFIVSPILIVGGLWLLLFAFAMATKTEPDLDGWALFRAVWSGQGLSINLVALTVIAIGVLVAVSGVVAWRHGLSAIATPTGELYGQGWARSTEELEGLAKGSPSDIHDVTWNESLPAMQKRCRTCERLLDSSSFRASGKEPDGLARSCSACVNQRRRELYAAKERRSGRGTRPRLSELVKRGDYAAVNGNRDLIDGSNRDRLLALAVMDFKSAPKKPGHVELVKLLIRMGAEADFHLVCAATVGPHVELIRALIDEGAEQNIYTAAALGEVARVHELLSRDSSLADQATDHAFLSEMAMTALHYACRSELGKVSEASGEQLFRCAELLLGRTVLSVAELGCGVSASARGSPLDMCAWRGGNVKIARLLVEHGWRPRIETVLAALGHFQRHGKGNYDVAALCLESGVLVNEPVGNRTLLHAFAHQGDLVGTTWLLERGAKIDVRDEGNNTPLHKACERNATLGVVRVLLAHGASLTAANKNGETALDVAVRNEKQGIAAYLRGIGAKPAVDAPIDQGKARS